MRNIFVCCLFNESAVIHIIQRQMLNGKGYGNKTTESRSENSLFLGRDLKPESPEFRSASSNYLAMTSSIITTKFHEVRTNSG